VARVKKVMKDNGVDDPKELDKAEEIYDAVKAFIDNTGFSVPLSRVNY